METPSRVNQLGAMGGRESESLVVPPKPGNSPERTRWREGGTGSTEPKERTMKGAPNPNPISTRLQRIATLAREIPGPLNTLAHHIDIEWLREAHRRTRKDGAVGVDGQSADEYAHELESNLQGLLDRAKSGTYRAPPVRRVEIPKAGKRPGLPDRTGQEPNMKG
jgi:hypothetical protein